MEFTAVWLNYISQGMQYKIIWTHNTRLSWVWLSLADLWLLLHIVRHSQFYITTEHLVIFLCSTPAVRADQGGMRPCDIWEIRFTLTYCSLENTTATVKTPDDKKNQWCLLARVMGNQMWHSTSLANRESQSPKWDKHSVCIAGRHLTARWK